MNNTAPDFSKGLLPCIVQDAETHRVLMLAYMNAEAFEKTVTDRRVTFLSRSKNRLWTKGETSGNFLELVDLEVDCDADTILALVNPAGPVCHTGADTCFNQANTLSSIDWLERIIAERKAQPREGSYTASLFESGTNKIAQKVGEEAVELVIEAKDDNKDLFLNEASDLLYHYLVLLQAKGCTMRDVATVLRQRHGK